MKSKIAIIPALLFVFLAGGCKKYLNVNIDPNNPTDVQESLLLVPIETATSTLVAGGSWTTGNYPTVAETDDYLVQQIALNQTPPQIDEYQMRPADYDQMFLSIYSTILENLRILNNKAEASGHHAYGVIAKVLTAYNLGVTTDSWGDIPYSKALAGHLTPTYDSQESIYKTMQSLLDSAIAENALDPGGITPGSDDFIYGGDMSLWQKFAYTLKARYDIHLTKAPGHDPLVQSNAALNDLQNGFGSLADEANFSAYSTNPGSESPWFENIDPGQGGVVLAATLIDSLQNRNDPRLPIIAVQGSLNSYLGLTTGTGPAPDVSVFSVLNTFYASKGSPESILSYPELEFIKAEAVFRVSGAAAANPIYINAINSAMARVGLDTTSAAVKAYVTSRTPLTAANAMQRIMEDKSIGNLLSTENYNDWRRTGFPQLTIVQNPHIGSIPRRFPYPLQEFTSNPQPQQSAAITDRVWWDAP
jgi:hypothetical protein